MPDGQKMWTATRPRPCYVPQWFWRTRSLLWFSSSTSSLETNAQHWSSVTIIEHHDQPVQVVPRQAGGSFEEVSNYNPRTTSAYRCQLSPDISSPFCGLVLLFARVFVCWCFCGLVFLSGGDFAWWFFGLLVLLSSVFFVCWCFGLLMFFSSVGL